jgi:hypothetical protein
MPSGKKNEESRAFVPKQLRIEAPSERMRVSADYLSPADVFEGKDPAYEALESVPEVKEISSDTDTTVLEFMADIKKAAKEEAYNGRQKVYLPE